MVAGLGDVRELAVTDGTRNVVLTNTGCWSPSGEWLVYDVRSASDGSVFDGDRIERVSVNSGKVEVLYQAPQGVKCGVVTHHPKDSRVIFILGPSPGEDGFTYGAARRQGVIVDSKRPGIITNLDARDLVSPFTPGALRGGSHVHVWHPLGDWVSFTYEDHILEQRDKQGDQDHDPNRRVVGVSMPGKVEPRHSHPRNHGGSHFSFVATPVVRQPRQGSDDLIRACEEAWIGRNGYLDEQGNRRKRSFAFQGTVLDRQGKPLVEVFVCDLPETGIAAGDHPLEGTERTMPGSPQGTRVRRLTRTETRKHPGIQGPRHWLRSHPEGAWIAFLAKDDTGIVQIYLISPCGGEIKKLTSLPDGIGSAFDWSQDGALIAHESGGQLCVSEVQTGETRVLQPVDPLRPIRPEAVVFSPQGDRIAYLRQIQGKNRIFVCKIPGK